ncbi:hypothetical protein [Rhabdothermincola salaria]|nr:hypothetical protein [Rhabdothermincola salaria]
MLLTLIFALLALVVVGAWLSLQRRRRAYEATEVDDLDAEY